MESKASSILFTALLCYLCSTSLAFNVTKILSQYPDYGNFNDLLSQTGLAQDINSRQTITVLALDNGSIDGLSGRPLDIAKRILSSHVILDYYDQAKFSKLKKSSSILTTLYQTTGNANDQQGFLNVTKTPDGIKFGSASKGAPLVASLLKSVYAQPYNISILQVSEPIIAPGIDNVAPPPPPNAGAPKKAPAPTAKSPSKAPTPSKGKPSKTPAGAPSEGPAAADAPAAEAPTADAPVSSPPEADTPSSDDADTPADAPKAASSSRVHVGGVGVVILLACLMGL